MMAEYNTTMKECSKCTIKKTFNNFYNDKSHNDGYMSVCKECIKKNKNKRTKERTAIRLTLQPVVQKICSTCKIKKQILHFYKLASTVDGYNTECKQCSNNRSKKIIIRLANNGPSIIRFEKICYKCKVKKHISSFTKNRCRPDGYHTKCKQCKYSEQKKDLRENLRNAVYKAITQYSERGKVKTILEYGIDIKKIIDYIGERPSKDHHLDHIIPISAFNYNLDWQIAASWHPQNLQWLLAEQNLSKHNKYEQEELSLYLENFKIPSKRRRT
jgi:hypothetical protein